MFKCAHIGVQLMAGHAQDERKRWKQSTNTITKILHKRYIMDSHKFTRYCAGDGYSSIN